MMEQDSDTIWCDGCGAEVPGLAVTLNLGDFCCTSCADGMGCGCRESEREPALAAA